MHGVARLMKALATRCNVAVVCTTHTVGGVQVFFASLSACHSSCTMSRHEGTCPPSMQPDAGRHQGAPLQGR